MKKIDMTGCRIGKLTVVEAAESRKGRTYWRCICDCGNETVVLTDNLRKANPIKSCGLCGGGGKKRDLTGQRYGRLVVVEEAKIDKPGVYWKCKCDCGNESIVRSLNLINTHGTRSCGCLHREKTSLVGKNTKKYNKYHVDGDTVCVELNDRGDTMLCDSDDWERLKGVKWNKHNSGYASARQPITGKTIFFHREVMGDRDGLVTDHINRNKMDNRKCNLRHVTFGANIINRELKRKSKSGYVGVYQNQGKWIAVISINGKHVVVCRSKNIEDAIKARKEAEEKYYKPLFEVK